MLKMTIFGEVTKEDIHRAVSDSKNLNIQLPIELHEKFIKAVAFCYRLMPQGEKGQRRTAQRALGEKSRLKPTYVEAIKASEDISGNWSRICVATQNEYRRSYIKFALPVMLMAGGSGHPKEFSISTISKIEQSLVMMDSAHRSKHQYLTSVWGFVKHTSPQTAADSALEAQYRAARSNLEDLVNPEDIESGPRLEHWVKLLTWAAEEEDETVHHHMKDSSIRRSMNVIRGKSPDEKHEVDQKAIPFYKGERLMDRDENITNIHFISASLFAYFAFLRPAEWKTTYYEKAKDLRGLDTVLASIGEVRNGDSIDLERSGTKTSRHPVSMHFECICPSVKQRSSASTMEKTKLTLHPCPVHCCNPDRWRKVASLMKKKLDLYWKDMWVQAGIFQFCRMRHIRHLSRIGACQSAFDSLESLERVMKFGRWLAQSSILLYQRDCARRPGLVSLPKWPIRMPMVLSVDCSIDQLAQRISALDPNDIFRFSGRLKRPRARASPGPGFSIPVPEQSSLTQLPEDIGHYDSDTNSSLISNSDAEEAIEVDEEQDFVAPAVNEAGLNALNNELDVEMDLG